MEFFSFFTIATGWIPKEAFIGSGKRVKFYSQIVLWTVPIVSLGYWAGNHGKHSMLPWKRWLSISSWMYWKSISSNWNICSYSKSFHGNICFVTLHVHIFHSNDGIQRCPVTSILHYKLSPTFCSQGVSQKHR